jgi:hypothetical protein
MVDSTQCHPSPKAHFISVKSSLELVLHDEFNDTKGVIRIRKSKKERQHNGQKTEGETTQWPKEKRPNNDLQNITYKTKDLVTRTLLKTGFGMPTLNKTDPIPRVLLGFLFLNL